MNNTKRNSKFRKRHPGYDKLWRAKHRSECAISYRNWRRKNRRRVRELRKEWRKNNPEKHNTHNRVYRAIKQGLLARPERCQKCDEKCKPQAHHKDYSKPLEVIWLCRICHLNEHGKSPISNIN